MLLEFLNISFFTATLIGAVISGLINITGVGGGVLIIPALSVILSIPPAMVIGTASLYATFSKAFSTISHIKSGTVDWYSSRIFLIGAVPNAIITAFIVNYALINYPEKVSSIQSGIYYLTIIFMLISCAIMLMPNRKIQQKSNNLGLIVGGIFVGIVMAMTGVGGGVLIIPALALVTALEMKQIVSCSIVIALIISGTTGLIYAKGGQLDITILIGLLFGSVIGIVLSERMRHLIPNKKLTPFIIVIIIISALLMLFRGVPA